MRLPPLPVGSPGDLGLPVRWLFTLHEAASQQEFFPLCLVLPLPGSITFSRVCSSVGGPVGVAHSFHPSLLLWWWPCLLLRWALLSLSSFVLSVPSSVFFALVSLLAPVALSPLLLRVFPDSFRHWCAFSFCRGASPLALVPSGILGGCGGSTNIALHRTWLVSAILPGAVGTPVSVFCFTVRHSARIHSDLLVSFTDSCVSLAHHSHEGLFLGHLRGVYLVGLAVLLRALPGLCYLR